MEPSNAAQTMTQSQTSKPLSVFQEIDRICIEFEDALMQGKAPRIEAFLDQVTDSRRSALLHELLLIETSYEQYSDTDESYNQRFQSYPQVVARVLTRARVEKATREDPETIGRYKVVRRIGSGSFGVVYEGFDGELKRAVAIKVPHRKWNLDTARLELALSEAQTLASLNHPNILPVYDVGKCDVAGVYLVTGMVNGVNLSVHTRQKSLDQRSAIRIVSQIADALESAHELGVVPVSYTHLTLPTKA